MNYKSDLYSDEEFYCGNSGNELQRQSPIICSKGPSNDNRATEMSKAELRKTNKPIMEKRRRARINHCLNELKMLILEAMKKDPARHTKLEKADILEMTVKHLQSVQRQQLSMAIQTDPSVIQKFKTGFMECADEVFRYINNLDDVDAAIKQRLCNHLNNCASNLEQIGSMANFNNGYRNESSFPANGNGGIYDFNQPSPLAGFSLNLPNVCTIFPTTPPQDVNNNLHGAKGATVQMGNIQLIPSRLPSGEIALIMPNAVNSQMTSLLMNPNNNLNLNKNIEEDANTNNLTQPVSTLNPATKRLSAFSKPQQNRSSGASSISSSLLNGSQTNTSQNSNSSGQYLPPGDEKLIGLQTFQPSSTASPPLSPISSLCGGHNEDTMHAYTKTYPRPSTPILDTPISPSSSVDNSMPSNRHLQQQQVSSTSGSNNSSANSSSSFSEQNGSLNIGHMGTSWKRSYSEISGSGGSSSASSEEEPPLAKKCNSREFNAISQEANEQDRMWRPW